MAAPHNGSAEDAESSRASVWVQPAASGVDDLRDSLASSESFSAHFSAHRSPWRTISESSAIVLCPLNLPVRELHSLVRWLDASLSRSAVLWGRPGPSAARREFVLKHRRTRVVLSDTPSAERILVALGGLVDPNIERSPRFPSEIPGVIRDDRGSTHEVTLENFSRTGVFIRSDVPLKLGVPVEVEFMREERTFRESVIPMRFADERGVGAEFEDPSEDWLLMFDRLSKGSVRPQQLPDRTDRVFAIPPRMRLRFRATSGTRRYYFRVREISARGFRASFRGSQPTLESPMEALLYWSDGSFSGLVALARTEPDIDGALEFVWTLEPLGLRELLARMSG